MTKKNDINQDSLVLTQTKPKTKKPSMYKVLLLNDDFTPMEFVVHILERFFNVDHQQAVSIMPDTVIPALSPSGVAIVSDTSPRPVSGPLHKVIIFSSSRGLA